MKSPRKNVLNKDMSQTKSTNQFLSVNKFDYPISPKKNIYTHKSPLKKDKFVNEKLQKQIQQNSRKTEYHSRMKQQHQRQRYKAKQLQYRINEQKQNQKKQKLMQQLQKKKMMLQNLQIQRRQLIKKHGYAEEKAKVMNVQVEIKRLKSEQSKRQQQKKQSQRYVIALQRVKSDKQLNNEFFRKRSQSIKRHEVNNIYKSNQRIEAQRYQTAIQARQEQKKRQKDQEQKQKQRKILDRFKQGKSIDYDKTCFHSVQKKFIILKEEHQNDQTSNTIKQKQEQTLEYERMITQRNTLKKLTQSQNRKKSVERGRQALRKLKQAKQYNQFIEETQQQQLAYNLQRIQKGKKNHLIGVKPDTISAYMRNKQQRAQQEFENMFLTPNKKTVQNNQSTYKNFVNESTKDRSSLKSFKNNSIKNSNHQSQSQDEKLRNIFTIPYNQKIHSIMLEKSKPFYQKKLFKQEQQQNNHCIFKNTKIQQINNNREGEINNFTLDYSVTDMEDAMC